MRRRRTAHDLGRWLSQIHQCSDLGDLPSVAAGIRASESWRLASGADHLAFEMELVDQLRRWDVSGPPPEGSDRLVMDALDECLVDAGALDGDRQYDVSRLRGQLADWVNDLAEGGETRLRQAALRRAVDHITEGAGRAESGIWFAAAVGCRLPQVVGALEQAMKGRNRELAAVAAFALLGLGPPTGARGGVIQWLRARRTKRPTWPEVAAVARLGDPLLAQALAERALPGVLDALESHGSLNASGGLLLRLWSEVAARNISDAALQDAMWAAVAARIGLGVPSGPRWLFLAGDIAERIDSPKVIASLLGWASNEGDPNHRWRCYSRLQSCVLRRQLSAWSGVSDARAEGALERDLHSRSDRSGPFETMESRRKLQSLDILFRLGREPSPEAVDDTLRAEPSPWSALGLSDVLACMRLTQLPSVARAWLTEVRDRDPAGGGEGSAQWMLARAAETLAASACSPDSLDALLAFGFTWDGNPMLSTAEALANVAVDLARSRAAGAVGCLLSRLESGETADRHRAAITVALEALGHAGHLGDSECRCVLDLYHRSRSSDGPAYLRRYLLSALGSAARRRTRLGRDVVALYETALLEEDRGSACFWAALEGLADACGLLRYPRILKDVLGLRRAGGRWTMPDGARWSESGRHAMVFSLAFVRAPSSLLPAARQLASGGTHASARQLARAMAHAGRGRADAFQDRELLEALARRAPGREWDEPEFFDDLRRISEDVIAKTRWDESWAAWTPHTRADLAAELGRCTGLGPDSWTAARRLLVALVGDGTYEVRRSTYRSLATLSQGSLRAMCAALMATGSHVSLRKRGAEACCWIEPDPPTDIGRTTYYRRAATDPERDVREAAERCLKERRDRELARQYVARVCAVQSMSNKDVLAAWPHGEALGVLGDDETMRELRETGTSDYLPPHIRHWRERLHKAVEDRWKKVQRDWPKPWRACDTSGLELGSAPAELEEWP